jgi:hypothetical protein
VSNYTPAVDAALREDAILPVLFVQLELPGLDTPLRWIDQDGALTISGQTFVGLDPIYGALAGVTGLGDGMDSDAPRPTISIFAPTMAAVAALCSPEAQTSRLIIWSGALDKTTGAVIPSPLVQFDGAIDVPVLRTGPGSRVVEITAMGPQEEFFDAAEMEKLSDPFHQYLFPGELGLSYATGVLTQQMWGVDTPVPAAVTDASF